MSNRFSPRHTTALTCFLLVPLLSTFLLANAAQGDETGPIDGVKPVNGERISVLIGVNENPNQPEEARRQIADAVAKMGGRVTHSYRIVPGMAVEIPAAAVANLLTNPHINLVELDGEMQAHAEEIPWGVTKVKALLNPTDESVEYTGGYSDPSIIVAVLDSGIDLDHPDLAGNIYTNTGEIPDNGVDDDGNGYIDDVHGWNFVSGNNFPDDDNGHGSHCAGTVGAVGNNDIGVVGVAPGVTLMPLKVLNRRGSGSFSDIIEALEYCVANGVHITSNSYGSSGDPGTLVRLAFDNARAAGVLNIASAGNSGTSSGTGDNVGYPAKYSSVVAVASTTQSDSRSSFSSTGPAVELAAPGSSILSTYKNGGYATLSGTSMACPHVAGAAAVLMADGVTDPDAVMLSLISSAVDLGDNNRDNQFGYGRIDVLAARRAASGGGGTGGGGGGGGGGGTASGVASVDSITYSTARRGRDLIVTVSVVQPLDGGGTQPVSGASVSIDLLHVDSNTVYQGTADTGADGTVSFRLRGAPGGTYRTTVTGVTATGLQWDGSSPANQFTL